MESGYFSENKVVNSNYIFSMESNTCLQEKGFEFELEEKLILSININKKSMYNRNKDVSHENFITLDNDYL